MTKLRNNRGETLVEVLASILIAALAVSLLFSFIITSSTMEKDNVKGADDNHYMSIAGADAASAAVSPVGTGTVRIISTISGTPTQLTDDNIAVINIYGGDGMFSYRRQP